MVQPDLGDLVHDLLVHGRCHLSAVGPGDLVAVVLLGVVRGGDHDACNGAFLAHGIAHLGSGTDVVEDIDMDAVGGKDIGSDAGELPAVVAAVVRDTDLDVVALDVLEDVVGESLGGHADRVLVHAVGADAHDAAEASGAELEILVERVLETCWVVVAQLNDLAFGLGIEISVQPALGHFVKIFHRVCGFNVRRGNRHKFTNYLQEYLSLQT